VRQELLLLNTLAHKEELVVLFLHQVDIRYTHSHRQHHIQHDKSGDNIMGFLSGLFGGGKEVQAPTLDQLRPESAQTYGTLFNTSYGSDGTSRVNLTGTGQDVSNRYKGIADTAQQGYNEFDVNRFADERYQLMRN
jgi:hypothetical protein